MAIPKTVSQLELESIQERHLMGQLSRDTLLCCGGANEGIFNHKQDVWPQDRNWVNSPIMLKKLCSANSYHGLSRGLRNCKGRRRWSGQGLLHPDTFHGKT
ncbi:hypothetical protein Y1Q_0002368 [Alligator mississippiensis]|uniref:Uncharacterized protein n=1 Tax=Alligator mississippiensis TaxID=8496 RepID=A0A151MGV6_ALLMI|nr:hypothetical protein Y1Q_0002368 [Alligator mississippiensis]